MRDTLLGQRDFGEQSGKEVSTVFFSSRSFTVHVGVEMDAHKSGSGGVVLHWHGTDTDYYRIAADVGCGVFSYYY